MTVDELIKELQRHAAEGHAALDVVFTYRSWDKMDNEDVNEVDVAKVTVEPGPETKTMKVVLK